MASYGDLIRKITTAEINRVQREGGYSRWAYFVDEHSGKSGVIFANDTTFAAYTTDDSPDPKLTQFGQEAISDLVLTPNPELLELAAGENTFEAAVFSDPLMIVDDDFTEFYTLTACQDWQRFLYQHGVQVAQHSTSRRNATIALVVIGGLIVIFLFIALA